MKTKEMLQDWRHISVAIAEAKKISPIAVINLFIDLAKCQTTADEKANIKRAFQYHIN